MRLPFSVSSVSLRLISFQMALLGITGLVAASPAQADNLHLIESNEITGYAMYRSGEPSAEEIKEYCRLGIQEIMVLSGNANQVEHRYQAACPTLKVIYNSKQNAAVPLSSEFLKQFDAWVESAMQRGIKVAFRCNCGCHRTGRLAAYYQMKFQKISSADAIRTMNRLGKYMWIYPQLPEQVRGLEDYILGRACQVKARSCVREI